MSSDSLYNLRVLVTRALHQQNNFIQTLRHHRALPVSFPLSEISLTPAPDPIRDKLQTLATFDFVIFVSPNAVTYANMLFSLPWENYSIQFSAIGNATQEKLLHYGQSVNVTPMQNQSSEGLLDLEAFKFVDGKRIAIIGGNISRPLLVDTLLQRGATIRFIEVYQNTLPVYSESEISNVFVNIDPQILCITSNQGILNLLEIVGPKLTKQLLDIPMIVNSTRCAKLARELGFRSDVVVAQSPGDQGQIDALRQWYLNQPIKNSNKDNGE